MAKRIDDANEKGERFSLSRRGRGAALPPAARRTSAGTSGRHRPHLGAAQSAPAFGAVPDEALPLWEDLRTFCHPKGSTQPRRVWSVSLEPGAIANLDGNRAIDFGCACQDRRPFSGAYGKASFDFGLRFWCFTARSATFWQQICDLLSCVEPKRRVGRLTRRKSQLKGEFL
jgi:hypothetical protein